MDYHQGVLAPTPNAAINILFTPLEWQWVLVAMRIRPVVPNTKLVHPANRIVRNRAYQVHALVTVPVRALSHSGVTS